MEGGVRVRGIYATALTRLLLDEGIPIADPTDVIVTRFGEEVKSGASLPALVTVKDREDRQALVAVGEGELLNRAVEAIAKRITCCVRRVWPGPNYTLKVKIVEKEGGGYLVEGPEGVRGLLFRVHGVKPGDLVLAHVAKPDPRRPLLRPGAVVTGAYARLVQGARHSLSEFIRDYEKASELLALASSLGLEGWGVRFRSSAAKAPLTRILDDLSNLKERAKELEKRASEAQEPCILERGDEIAFILLPLKGKRDMDEVRSKQQPTLPLHHFFKSIDRDLSTKVDLFEEALACCNRTCLSEVLLGDYLKRIKRLNSKYVTIIHEKIGGDTVYFKGKAEIVDENEVVFAMERVIKSEGVYDGLNVEKKPGDVARTIFAPFSPLLAHVYYGEGAMKGAYISVGTPLELAPSGRGWYLDLEVDVVAKPSGEAQVIDLQELERAVEKGEIAEEVAQEAINIARKVEAEVSKGFTEEKIVELVSKLKTSPITARNA